MVSDIHVCLSFTMNTSSKALYDYFDDTGDIGPAIVWDIFGYMNWNDDMKQNRDDTLTLFLGLFKGLYNMGVTHTEIHRCFMLNQLDMLIHTKYSIVRNGYYREFCNNKIRIGNTFINNGTNIIYHPKAFIYTILPSYITFVSLWSSFCNIDSVLYEKINTYKKQDTINQRAITDKYVSVKDVKRLLSRQEQKCYVCGDVVLISEEFYPRCMYQFTLDRIDNNLPHNKDNVLVSCYYCNCYGESTTRMNKKCPNHCHCVERQISRKRTNVPIEEIEYLRLKW